LDKGEVRPPLVLLVRPDLLVQIPTSLALLRFRPDASELEKQVVEVMSAGIRVIQHSDDPISWRDYNSSPSACQQATDLPLGEGRSAAGEEPVSKPVETPVFPEFRHLFAADW
jgi:hypothetical protein